MHNDTYITLLGALFQRAVMNQVEEAEGIAKQEHGEKRRIAKQFAVDLRRELNNLFDIPKLVAQFRLRKIDPEEILAISEVKKDLTELSSKCGGNVWVVFAIQYAKSKKLIQNISSMDEYKDGRAVALAGGGKNPYPIDVFPHYVWKYGFSSVLQDGQTVVYGTHSAGLL